jgi:hypothetical protein
MSHGVADESARQRALDTYRIVDTLPEQAYDDIVRLATAVCDAPIALVSLIDRDRQWFKANVGMEGTGTRRDLAFCNHAIDSPGQLMEVTDAALDARFVDNPLVTGGQHLRFYAGVPLVTPGGQAIGTICVMDRKPRVLDQVQRDALAALARMTMNLLDGCDRERTLERTMLLAAQAPSGPSQVDRGMCTVAIFEVTGLPGWAARIGERAVEKSLEQVGDALHDCLSPSGGDVINRVTGSPEYIAVLQGADTGDTLRRLHERVLALEHEAGVHVLMGSARTVSASEPLEAVYQRADRALSAEKDKASGAHADPPADH